jgi:hypothetical protein
VSEDLQLLQKFQKKLNQVTEACDRRANT